MGEVVQLSSYRAGMAGARTADYTCELTDTGSDDRVVDQAHSHSSGLTENDEIKLILPDRNSLIPIELAVGSRDRNYCLTRMAKYEICAIHIRRVKDDPDALLYLMSVNDAIWLNKEIIEESNLTDDEICRRIDLIQMLENVNGALMDSLWDSFTERSQAIIS